MGFALSMQCFIEPVSTQGRWSRRHDVQPMCGGHWGWPELQSCKSPIKSWERPAKARLTRERPLDDHDVPNSADVKNWP